MIVCSQCGYQNDDDDQFCGGCPGYLPHVGTLVQDNVDEAPVVEGREVEDPGRGGLVERVKAMVRGDEEEASGGTDVLIEEPTTAEEDLAAIAERDRAEAAEQERAAAERERLAAEERERAAAERERLAAQERERLAAQERERVEAAERTRVEAERRAAAEVERRAAAESERRAAAEAAERAAAAEQRTEEERRATEARRREEDERRAAEEAKRQAAAETAERERLAAEERARAEAAEQEREAVERERQAAEARRRAEEERRAAEEAERRAAAEAQERARRAAAMVAKAPSAPAAAPPQPVRAQPPAATAATAAITDTGASTAARQPSAQTPAPPRPRPPTRKAPPSRVIEPGDLVCGQCGEPNKADRRFCRRCAASLDEAQVAKVPFLKRVFRRRTKQVAAGERPGRGGQRGKGTLGKARTARSGFRRWSRRLVAVAALIGVAGAVGPWRATIQAQGEDLVQSIRDRFAPELVIVTPLDTTASSSLPDHPPTNATNGINENHWTAQDPGEKHVLTVVFDPPVDLRQVGFLSGASGDAFRLHHRPQDIQLTFDTGESVDVKLDNNEFFQAHGVKADGVREAKVHILSLYRSNEGKPVSITNIQFSALPASTGD